MRHGLRILRWTLATALLGAALAVPARAYVYWTVGGVGIGGGGTTIGRANLDGGGVTHALVTTAANPALIAVDATHIYWSNGSSIGRANLDGTGADPTWLTPQLGAPRGLAVDGAHIYWTNGSGYIARAGLDGQNEDDQFIPAGGAYALAVSQGTIYFTDTQRVLKVAASAGATPTQIGSPLPTGQQATGLAVAGSTVYWAIIDTLHAAPASTIGRMQTSGTNQNNSYITGLYQPFGIAGDGTYIYWVDHGNTQNTIGRALLGSVTATDVRPSFISEPGGPSAVAVDSGIDATSTALSCRPSPISTGFPMTCTATVTDAASSAVPTGTVNLTGNAATFFSGNPCLLTPTSAGASCVVGSVPTSAGMQTITATYSGDGVHQASSAGTTICAGSGCTITPTPTPAPQPKPPCTVPKLKGKTLGAARRLLKAGHCALGKVTRPRVKRHRKLGQLVIGSQRPAAGRKLAAGSEVAVTLVKAPKRKRKR